MTPKHTAGEWILQGGTIKAGGRNLGRVNSYNSIEGRANGVLMVAAPKLLAALREIIRQIAEAGSINEDGIKQALIAIAEATK